MEGTNRLRQRVMPNPFVRTSAARTMGGVILTEAPFALVATAKLKLGHFFETWCLSDY